MTDERSALEGRGGDYRKRSRGRIHGTLCFDFLKV